MKHLLLFPTFFFFSLKNSYSSFAILSLHFLISPCFRHSRDFKESVMRDTPQAFPYLNLFCLFYSLLEGRSFKRLLYWICIFMARIRRGTQTSCCSWGSVPLVQSWFLILETRPYFFLIEADVNIKIQLNTFSKWRRFSGSELLPPALCPGYSFLAFACPEKTKKKCTVSGS